MTHKQRYCTSTTTVTNQRQRWNERPAPETALLMCFPAQRANARNGARCGGGGAFYGWALERRPGGWWCVCERRGGGRVRSPGCVGTRVGLERMPAVSGEGFLLCGDPSWTLWAPLCNPSCVWLPDIADHVDGHPSQTQRGETAEDASGTRPFLQILSCGTRPGRVRGRFSQRSCPGSQTSQLPSIDVGGPPHGQVSCPQFPPMDAAPPGSQVSCPGPQASQLPPRDRPHGQIGLKSSDRQPDRAGLLVVLGTRPEARDLGGIPDIQGRAGLLVVLCKRPGRNGRGRVPDASHTIEFEETDASRTRAQPFLLGGTGGWRGRGAGMARNPRRKRRARARATQRNALPLN
eukprot:gene12383-biopygen410